MWNPVNYKWKLVQQYIWYCEDTGKYHFQDECEQIDPFGYNSEEEVLVALYNYAEQLADRIDDGDFYDESLTS